MDFLALPEEQARMLLGLHRRRPLQAVAYVQRSRPRYSLVPMEEGALVQVLRHPEADRVHRVRLLLREAAAPGGLAWQEYSDELDADNPLNVEKSGCISYWASGRLGEQLVVGSLDYPQRYEYWYYGADPDLVRRFYQTVARQLRRLCPYPVADAETVEAVRKGEIQEADLRGHLTYASPGAMEQREAGGVWVTPMVGLQGWEYEPLTAP